MEEKNVSSEWTIILQTIEELYKEIDTQTEYIETTHHNRLHCRKGCFSCCVEDISVFEVEAENIRHHHSELLEKELPHPVGVCAFLSSKGACRIYENRPYVCRTQGLPLRWIEETDQNETIEMRDICPLNDDGEPIETIPEAHCWTIGPVEEALAKLQSCIGENAQNRVFLRDLFKKKSS